MTINLKQLLEYLDLKIRKTEEELEYLRIVREFLEYMVDKLSVEPSEEELPGILSDVKWRRYPSGSSEWCFADQLPRRFIEELIKHGSRIVNGYRYTYKKLTDGREVVSRKLIKQ